MKLRALLPMIAFALTAAPAAAVPGGKLATLALGTWFCELPGDAVSEPVPQPADTFTAVPDSSYRTPDGKTGTYLLLDDVLTMTSGPREGDRFGVESTAMVHKLGPDGRELPLRCVRAGDPAAMAIVPTRPTETQP